ncbi:MAG: hypothetical protein IJF64_01250 [Clostridia bacterium]|nr:hypothetical protein [Clostridia bacterium]
MFAFTCNGQSKKIRTGAFAALKENQRFSEPMGSPQIVRATAKGDSYGYLRYP